MPILITAHPLTAPSMLSTLSMLILVTTTPFFPTP